MALKFTPVFIPDDIQRRIQRSLDVVDNIIYEQLQIIGEEFVINARSTKTYQDRTGNLRSSIGYSILKDGKILIENYEGTAEGQKNAIKIRKNNTKKIRKGWQIVFVAGMHYAGYVEAKGYDVITGSSHISGSALKEAIDRVQQLINTLRT